jgi:putative methyltransferase (TIGR04325 family)
MFRELARDWLPPILQRLLIRHVLGGGAVRYSGDFAGYDQALAVSGRYDQRDILQRVVQSTAAVESGQAAMERDGVTFDHIEHPWPALAGLLRQAALDGGRLSVLDFGGALGSTYRQCRPLLRGLGHVRWAVVEQSHFVEAGRAQFQTDTLRFHDEPAAAIADIQPNVLLLSSVLPYLPNPWETLEELLDQCPWPCVIVDRTAIWDLPDRLTVQSVPASIYGSPVRYPAWIFEARSLRQALAKVGPVIEFDSRDGQTHVQGHCVRYIGMMVYREAVQTHD